MYNYSQNIQFKKYLKKTFAIHKCCKKIVGMYVTLQIRTEFHVGTICSAHKSQKNRFQLKWFYEQGVQGGTGCIMKRGPGGIKKFYMFKLKNILIWVISPRLFKENPLYPTPFFHHQNCITCSNKQVVPMNNMHLYACTIHITIKSITLFTYIHYIMFPGFEPRNLVSLCINQSFGHR